ncbi:MAG: flippase-like domain-containing protein [Elusimicrobiales bacterium]|nr:flippase-like domain-containing protein [Elusimicrobiales bacterium]
MKRFLYKYLPLIIALTILLWLIYPNHKQITEVYRISKKNFLLLSFLSSFLSYFFMSLSLHEMLKILGYKIPFNHTFIITLISSTVNYFISSAGISGFALRTHLLNIKKVPVSIAITISVVLTAFIYLILGFIILQSFLLYFLEVGKITFQLLEGFIGALIIFLIPFFMTIIIYNQRFRNRWAIRTYYFINKTLYQITKHNIPKEDFRDFKDQLNYGIKILHSKKMELPKVAAYVLLDWIFNIMVLYFAFKSVGVSLNISNLVIGFSFGILMTIIPFIPSGLGFMELIISAYYSNYNISFELAIFASLVFRIFYHLIPFLISLILYYGIKTMDTNIEEVR